METVLVSLLVGRAEPYVTDRTDIVAEVGDRVVAVGRLHIRHVACRERVGNLGCTHLVGDGQATALIVRENLCNSVFQCGETAVGTADTGIDEVLTERKALLGLIVEASLLYQSHTTGIFATIPGTLQLERALLEQGADGLSIR